MSRFLGMTSGPGLAALAALAISSPWAAAAQSTIVDIRGLAPREVKTEAFSLASSQEVQIEAVGAESDALSGKFTWVKAIWQRDVKRSPWAGNGWILDLNSRKVVWELSAASTSPGAKSSREFKGSVRLPAGSYAAFYSAFPDGEYWTDGDGKTVADRKWHWFGGDEPLDLFKLVVRASGQRIAGAEADRQRLAFAADAVVALRASSGERFQQTGFTLAKQTDVDVYAVGEAREDSEFDYGWIINADTRAKVWKLSWRDSVAAGGAEKNRAVRLTRTLPAGRYAAFFATDDSHDPSEWNSPPPHDPYAWGLTVTVRDASARAAVRTFAYEDVPASASIVALTRMGDGEARKQGFTLNRPMDVRIYALGEGRDGQMFDYGWITNADTRARVWEMRYGGTEGAGGDPKNRLVDTTIRLERGNYLVHYISDGSHSADGWNASAPADGRHWGISLLATQGPVDRSSVAAFQPKADPSILVQLTEVRDDDRVQKRFSLERASDVRIYALGEGTLGDMVDYAWIEDAKTGRRVWQMTYGTSEHAGGAAKNRKFDGVIKLPAGDYLVHFETDGSHAFGDWNAAAPSDPDAWGVTVYRVSR